MPKKRYVLIAPPPKNERTGGYLYNAHCARELEELDLFFCKDEDLLKIDVSVYESRIVLDSLYLVSYGEVIDQFCQKYFPIWMLHCFPHFHSQDIQLLPLTQKRLGQGRGAIVNSRFMARELRRITSYEYPCRVVYPGVELVSKPQASVPQKQTLNILTVANLDPLKCLVEIAQALGELQDLDWRWSIVGDTAVSTSYTELVRRTIDQEGIKNRVEFLGILGRAEVVQQYLQADLFVMLSNNEAYGMVFAEALSFGVPVIARQNGGPCEIISHNKTGLLWNDDLPQLSQHLRYLLTDSGIRYEMRKNALKQQFPSWSQTAQNFQDACDQLW